MALFTFRNVKSVNVIINSHYYNTNLSFINYSLSYPLIDGITAVLFEIKTKH